MKRTVVFGDFVIIDNGWSVRVYDRRTRKRIFQADSFESALKGLEDITRDASVFDITMPKLNFDKLDFNQKKRKRGWW